MHPPSNAVLSMIPEISPYSNQPRYDNYSSTSRTGQPHSLSSAARPVGHHQSIGQWNSSSMMGSMDSIPPFVSICKSAERKPS